MELMQMFCRCTKCPVCKQSIPSHMVYKVDWRQKIIGGHFGQICHECNKEIDRTHFTHIPVKAGTLDKWLEEHEKESITYDQ